MKIYVVNLDKATQRLAHMREQLGGAGLEFTRVPAVYGAAIDLSPYAETGLTPGEIGCFLSHRDIWGRIVISGDDHALVLEDDVRLSADFRELVSNPEWLPKTFGIAKLDTSAKKVGVTRSSSPASTGRAAHRLLTAHLGSAAYIVSRAAASDLLRRSEQFHEPVDHFLFGDRAVTSIHVLQVVPAPVAQEKRFDTPLKSGLESAIVYERRARKATGLRRFMRNVVRPLRQLGTGLTRLYRTAREDIRFVRVPFR